MTINCLKNKRVQKYTSSSFWKVSVWHNALFPFHCLNCLVTLVVNCSWWCLLSHLVVRWKTTKDFNRTIFMIRLIMFTFFFKDLEFIWWILNLIRSSFIKYSHMEMGIPLVREQQQVSITYRIILGKLWPTLTQPNLPTITWFLLQSYGP